MPYVPLDQTRVLWDEKGKPYWASQDGRQRHYIPPIVAAQYRDDPRMLQWAQSQGFSNGADGMTIAPGAGAGGNRPLDFRSSRQWDPRTGEYDTDFDWGDIVTLAAGGVIGAGAASAIGGASAGGSAAAPSAASSSVLPSTPIMATAAPTSATTVGGGVSGAMSGGSAGAGGGGWLSQLGSRNVLGAASRGLGAYSEAAANNRGAEFGGQALMEQAITNRDREFHTALINREQEGRDSGNDAWRRLMAAERTLSPGPRPQLSPYSVAPRQVTEAERTGAEAMRAEVMARLQGGNPLPQIQQRPLAMDPSLLKPGTAEKVSGWLSPILSGAGRLFGR